MSLRERLSLAIIAAKESRYEGTYELVDGRRVTTNSRHAYENVYRALGMTESQISSRTIPKSLNKTVVVNGNQWTVYPATGAFAEHRLFVRCAVCERLIPGGRMYQHIPVHEIEAGLAERVKRADGTTSRTRFTFLNGYQRG